MIVQTWYRVDKASLTIEPFKVIGESNLIVRMPGPYNDGRAWRRKETAIHKLFKQFEEARAYAVARQEERIRLAQSNLRYMEARLAHLSGLEPSMLRPDVGRDTIQPTQGASVP